MNTGFAVFDKSFKVSTSDEFSADYLLAKLGANANEVTLCGAGEQAIGAIQHYQGADGDALDAGEPVNVRILGETYLVAAAAVTKGDRLKAAASGKATPATASEDLVVAIALESASGDGKLFKALLTPGSVYIEKDDFSGTFSYYQEKNSEAIVANAAVVLESGKLDTAGAGEVAIGFAKTAIAQNGYGYVQTGGIATGIASGAINAQAHVKCAANGKLAATTTQGDYCIGIAVTAASAEDDTLSVLISPHNYVGAGT